MASLGSAKGCCPQPEGRLLPPWEKTRVVSTLKYFKVEQGTRMSPKYWAQEMEAEVASASE